MSVISRAKRGKVGPEREFIDLFGETARYRNRWEVFQDFVTCSALALRNAIPQDPELEKEYLDIVGKYKKEDVYRFTELISHLVDILQAEPHDALGKLFMDLELGNKYRGQFFTPDSVSQLMAGLQMGGLKEKIAEQGYISLSEPACGAGGMIMAVVKHMIEQGYNPSQHLFVEAWDVDKTAADMCFIQLALWHVPAEIVVGNTLTLEVREVMHTPSYHMGLWSARLPQSNAERAKAKL
jgi:type I restriction-modification system DNA methylase subunit